MIADQARKFPVVALETCFCLAEIEHRRTVSKGAGIWSLGGQHLQQTGLTRRAAPFEFSQHGAVRPISGDDDPGVKNRSLGDDLYMVSLGNDARDRFALSYRQAVTLTAPRQPMIELVPPDDAKNGTPIHDVGMTPVDQFQFLNRNVWAIIAQTQTFENPLTLAGDRSAAELVAGVDCFVNHHGPACPVPIGIDQVQGGGHSGRAGTHDQHIHVFSLRH